MKRNQPTLTVDGIIVFGKRVLLIKRKNNPYRGMYALPGGFVEYGETVEKAIIREVLEETGIITRVDRLIGVYSDLKRDPRGHMISIVFRLNVVGGVLHASDDAMSVEFVPIQRLKEIKLAFDHKKILVDAYLIKNK